MSFKIQFCLVGIYLSGWWFLTILKTMNSSMGRMTSHILWKIKFMFETTNQFIDGKHLSSSNFATFISKNCRWNSQDRRATKNADLLRASQWPTWDGHRSAGHVKKLQRKFQKRQRKPACIYYLQGHVHIYICIHNMYHYVSILWYT